MFQKIYLLILDIILNILKHYHQNHNHPDHLLLRFYKILSYCTQLIY